MHILWFRDMYTYVMLLYDLKYFEAIIHYCYTNKLFYPPMEKEILSLIIRFELNITHLFKFVT